MTKPNKDESVERAKRKCAFCNKEFIPNKRQIYCSDSCRNTVGCRKYNSRHLLKCRKLGRDNYWKNKERILIKRKKDRLNDIDKHNSRDVYKTADYFGKIKKKDKCEVCGKISKTDAHHKDYSKPLEVVYVCRSCHFRLHHRGIQNE